MKSLHPQYCKSNLYITQRVCGFQIELCIDLMNIPLGGRFLKKIFDGGVQFI